MALAARNNENISDYTITRNNKEKAVVLLKIIKTGAGFR